MTSLLHNIKLKIGCDGVSDIKFHPEQDKLVIGTIGGRVRIFDCSYEDPIELFRKRWHKNLTRLSVSKSGLKIGSSSSQGSIKHHDFETGKEIWKSLEAHEDSISALVWQTDHLFISGDDSGTVKIWDDRQKEAVCDLDVCREEEERDNDYLGGVNDLVLDDNCRHLFVAMDDGVLVTVNTRRRKVEMSSESLSYSIKSVQPFKNQTKLAVGTDEGVISIFNWNEFGNLSDRFPVATVDDPIEKMVKINENVMAVATASGRIKATSLLPNLILSDIGKHSFSKTAGDDCGDCMTIVTNSDCSFIVSGCPESNIVCFYSPEIVLKEFKLEQSDRTKNKRKKDRAVIKDRNKRKKMENDGFLDGIASDDEKIAKNSDNDDSSDEEDDEDSDD